MGKHQKNQSAQTLYTISDDVFSPFKGQCLKKDNRSHQYSSYEQAKKYRLRYKPITQNVIIQYEYSHGPHHEQ
jgi:hypothetical protein